MMKLTIVLFLLLCGLSLFVTAKPTNGSGFRQQDNAQEQEVLRLHQELYNAWWVNHDAKVAERLVADDYFAVNSDGSTSDKAMAVAIARSNEKVEIKEEDMKMRVYNNTAVCTYKLLVMTNPNDKRSPQKARIAEVWVKRKGAWQLTVLQSTNCK